MSPGGAEERGLPLWVWEHVFWRWRKGTGRKGLYLDGKLALGWETDLCLALVNGRKWSQLELAGRMRFQTLYALSILGGLARYSRRDWPRESFLYFYGSDLAKSIFFYQKLCHLRFCRIRGTLMLRYYVDPCFFFAFHMFYAGAGVKLKDTNASKTAPYSAQVPCT